MNVQFLYINRKDNYFSWGGWGGGGDKNIYEMFHRHAYVRF